MSEKLSEEEYAKIIFERLEALGEIKSAREEYKWYRNLRRKE